MLFHLYYFQETMIFSTSKNIGKVTWTWNSIISNHFSTYRAAILLFLRFFKTIMVALNSSCLNTYKKTFNSCFCLMWLWSYEKTINCGGHLGFFFFYLPKGANSTLTWISLYIQQRWMVNNENKIQAKRGYPLSSPTKREESVLICSF